MDIEKLIENAKACCGDTETEDCAAFCINPRDTRGGEVRWCRQWLIHDLHAALSTLQAELEQVKRERDAAIRDIKCPFVCTRCKRPCDGDETCIDNGYMDFEWIGVPIVRRGEGDT